MTYPIASYKHDYGQKITTDAKGVSCYREQVARFPVSAANAIATAAAAVLAQTNLGAEAQTITTNITDPGAVRALSVVGNVSGIIDDVVITGKAYDGSTISETFTLNGTTIVNGSKAFKEITSVALPAQTNTPVEQVETIEVTGAPSSDGDVTFAITAAVLGDDSPASVVVPLVATTHDDVTKAAAAIVEALNADATISAAFTASNEAGVISLTANEPAANDTTLSIAFTDTDTTSATCGASTNDTAGVPYDKVSVGINDKLGLPYKLERNTVLMAFLDNTLEGTAPTVATDADNIEGNTVDLNSALDGSAVEIYLIV